MINSLFEFIFVETKRMKRRGPKPNISKPPTKDIMLNYLNGGGRNYMAATFKVSKVTIHNWMKEYGIKSKTVWY